MIVIETRTFLSYQDLPLGICWTKRSLNNQFWMEHLRPRPGGSLLWPIARVGPVDATSRPTNRSKNSATGDKGPFSLVEQIVMNGRDS